MGEPAGAEGPVCCMVNRVLSTVNLDTASGNRSEAGGASHELQLVGLKDPKAFKEMVWQMKRNGSAGLSSPPQQNMSQPVVVGAADTDLAPLLRRTNELLEEIARNTASRT